MQAAGLPTAANAPSSGVPHVNPTSRRWRELVTAHAFPFVKVSVLRDNLAGEDLSDWERVVERGGYASRLIHEHLERVRPPAAALAHS